MEYLGFWVTRTGIQPINNKVEAIVNIMPPKNKKYVHSFIGLVNYYRDMWAKQPHILQPLIGLTSKKLKFKWKVVDQKLFDEIKRIVARDTLLIYTDSNKRFDIHMYAIELHLGAMISQDRKPIAFYSSKRTG